MTYTTTRHATGNWGRAWESGWFTSLSSLAIMTTTPLLVFYFFIAVTHYNGSLTAPLAEASTLWYKLPTLSGEAFLIWTAWMGLQLLLWNLPDQLHKIFPSYRGGKQLGAISPQGNQLEYRINGLQAWILSHVIFFSASFIWSPTLLLDHWGALLLLANIAGTCLALFAFLKAHLFPTDSKERKFSGSKIYDFYMGIEFNPRLGDFDFKLFFNGRPGIVAWTLINLSFTAAQYAKWGYVTNSMILVNLLQAIYVLHFFWYEAWYLKTIDICHDHFGWMLAWGDLVWLPWMYTLQGFYLVYNPVSLSWFWTVFVLALGFFGYALFRSSNTQKDLFRNSKGICDIWGKKAAYIPANYQLQDGKTCESKLLISGWWKWGRHLNYTGDLMLSLAYCMACGFEHLLPYFYFIFMTILLVHRCIRDEHRLKHKYGRAWDSYCKTVPYRLIPGVF